MFAPRGANSPPARHRREAPALWAVAAKGGKATRRCAGRKRVPSGHLPPKVAKRPEGVSKYKGCARPARRTPIFARERNERWARSAPSAKIERPGKAGRYEFTLEGTEGSVSPVARREACALWALGPKAQSDPKVRRREASALWAVARSAKRPAGVSKYKGCARPARRTPIFARAAKP